MPKNTKSGFNAQGMQGRPGHANVGLVRLEGSIMPGGAIDFFKANFLLESAFQTPDIDAVVLYINSPGGTPTQSEMIGKRIRELSKANGKPVITIVGDMGASGGYWIAAAGDEVHIYRTSAVGSIGVRQDGKGVVEKMKKEGVEDRTLASGKKKVTNSPYEPVNPKEQANELKKLQFLHKEFVKWVQERRGSKLDDSLIDKNNVLDSELFSGEIWFGEEAVKVGLADGVGTLNSVIEDKFGKSAKIIDVHLAIARTPGVPSGRAEISEEELSAKAANDFRIQLQTISKPSQIKAKAPKPRIRVKATSSKPK